MDITICTFRLCLCTLCVCRAIRAELRILIIVCMH